MHRDLKDLLPSAVGSSRFVVVVFLDVRGFSSFAKLAESSETAEFLKSAYVRILEDYFPQASFFKPTGDGLLVVLDYDKDSLRTVVENAVATSVRLVDDFAQITADDPMVNFAVPADLGIGLARGAATCLMSGDKVLDYSGRPLNLASRLMDVARPSGVVFESTLDPSLLESKTMDLFREELIYVKGLAEAEPITAYCLASRTVVPDFNRSPINRFARFVEDTETIPLSELEDRGRYNHPLSQRPAKTDDMVVYLSHPALTRSGRRKAGMSTTMTFGAEYVTRQNRHYARVDYAPIAARLKRAGVKRTWPISITPEYSVRGAPGE